MAEGENPEEHGRYIPPPAELFESGRPTSPGSGNVTREWMARDHHKEAEHASDSLRKDFTYLGTDPEGRQMWITPKGVFAEVRDENGRIVRFERTNIDLPDE